MSEDLVFGKEYLETEKEGYNKYWDSLFKSKESKIDESKKSE